MGFAPAKPGMEAEGLMTKSFLLIFNAALFLKYKNSKIGEGDDTQDNKRTLSTGQTGPHRIPQNAVKGVASVRGRCVRTALAVRTPNS